MRLNMIAVFTAAKQINKARVTGKLSLIAVAKLNLLSYYIKFAKEQIGLGKEEYKDKYQLLVEKFDRLVFKCPETICNVAGDSYTYTGLVTNPYNPTVPTTPTDPNPDPGTDNDPATIGDYTMTVDDNTTTVLTMGMFTSTYSDPEGDLIDAIRIDDIHTTNQGIFYFNGTPINVGLIIMREDIELGKLTHKASKSEAITTDSFEFSVRDEGSGVWVN